MGHSDTDTVATSLTRGGPAPTVVLSSGATSEEAEIAIGTGAHVGRFVVLEQVGVGGMGRVLRGYDPKLRREVALKLMRASTAATADRMLREAQAMARLSHPNVVPVYDVGEHAGGVFIAMEYVEGQTLRAWFEAEPRPWRTVLAVFRDAGRGLAAAHRAGLVHRDFKPDNVLVPTASDERVAGRARVMDFGIARALEDSSSHEAEQAQATFDPDHTGSVAKVPRATRTQALTELGTLVGTPAYMAPEQHRGDAADERSDQYAFCVALYEALVGERPFPGKSPTELALAKERGEPRSPSARAPAVPRWVRRVVLRGLSPDPGSRWPSMDSLVDALGRDPHRRMAKMLILPAGALGLSAVAAAIVGTDEPPCTGAAERLAGSWDADRRERVDAALRATGASHAEHTASRVRERLDVYAAQWVSSHTEACLATHQRGEQSQALLDARMVCLHGRRRELAALVDTLGSADAEVVDKAVDAAASLPAIERCDDPAYVLAQVPPPDDPQTQQRVEALRERLAEARALQSAGKYADGSRICDEVQADAATVDYPPVRAEIAYRRGWLLEGTGAYEESVESLRQAYFGARRSGMDEVAAEAASTLVYVLAQLARYDEALRWAEHASIELERFGNDESRSYLLGAIAIVHDGRGAYDEAVRLHEEALPLRRAALGPEHPGVAQSLNNLARVQLVRGDYESARRNFDRALAIWEAARGPEHPSVAQTLNNIAAVMLEQGEHEDARPLYERALAIWENGLGAEHPSVATALNNLALVHRLAGRWDEAEQLHTRALAIHEKSLGPDHPLVATSLGNLAKVVRMRGEVDEALRLHERALAIRERALGPDHVHVGTSLGNVADLLRELGRFDEAERLHARVLAIVETALGPNHPDVAFALTGMAETALARDQADRALSWLERAHDIRGQDGVPATDLADTKLPLARARWALGDRGQAVALAREAADIYRSAGNGHTESLADAEGWLAAHTVTP